MLLVDLFNPITKQVIINIHTIVDEFKTSWKNKIKQRAPDLIFDFNTEFVIDQAELSRFQGITNLQKMLKDYEIILFFEGDYEIILDYEIIVEGELVHSSFQCHFIFFF